MKYNVLTSVDIASTIEMDAISNFLLQYSRQCYNRPYKKEHVTKAVEFALSRFPHQGGLIVTAHNESEELVGVCVINKTGMEGYFPENVLVHIGVHPECKEEKVEVELIKKAISFSKGSIALHLELDNPLQNNYKELGFSDVCVQMNLIRE